MKQPTPARIDTLPEPSAASPDDEFTRLAAIVTGSDDAIIGMNLEGIIFAWNNGAEKIYGFAPEAIKGKHFSLLIPPDKRDAVNASIEAIRQGKHVEPFEARRIRPDGAVTHLSTALSAIKDARGRVNGTSIITRDITKSRLSEEALAKERVLLRTVLDNLTDHVYVKDTAGRYILDNPAHRVFLGVGSPEDVEGRTVFFFFPKQMAERYHADDIAIIRSGEPLLNREETTVTRKGETILLSTTKVPFRDERGEIAGLVCLSRNLTALQRAAQQAKPGARGKTK